MSLSVEISIKFNVMPGPNGGVIMVPGCEPTSTLTSTHMEADMQAHGVCKAAIASVNDVLAAIPGTYVERLPNMGWYSGRALLVFPARSQTCPCSTQQDFYKLLKGIGSEIEGEELTKLLDCDAFSVDSCTNRPEWRG